MHVLKIRQLFASKVSLQSHVVGSQDVEPYSQSAHENQKSKNFAAGSWIVAWSRISWHSISPRTLVEAVVHCSRSTARAKRACLHVLRVPRRELDEWSGGLASCERAAELMQICWWAQTLTSVESCTSKHSLLSLHQIWSVDFEELQVWWEINTDFAALFQYHNS